MLRSDSNTRVCDRDDSILLLLSQLKRDRSVFRGIFEGILKQVEKELSEQGFLSSDNDTFFSSGEMDRDMLLLPLLLESSQHLIDEIGEIDGFHRPCKGGLLYVCKQQHIFHKSN